MYQHTGEYICLCGGKYIEIKDKHAEVIYNERRFICEKYKSTFKEEPSVWTYKKVKKETK